MKWTPEMEVTRVLYRKWLKWTLLIFLFLIVLWFVVSLLFWFGDQVVAWDMAWGSMVGAGDGIVAAGSDSYEVWGVKVLKTIMNLIIGVVGFIDMMLLLVLINISPFWILNKRAGLPGRWALVPIYNVLLYCDLAGFSRWSSLLLLIPFVNIVFVLILDVHVAMKFGKSVWFWVGMFILPCVFFPILAASRAEWGVETRERFDKLSNLDQEIAELERVKKKKQLEKEIRDLEN